MKKIQIFLSLILLLGMPEYSTIAQNKQQDSVAILIVDRMADVIGDMTSCSFKLHVSRDETYGTELIKHFNDFEVYMSGKDKLLINYEGDKGKRHIWYNGNQLAYYFQNEHNYGVVPAPSTTLEMFDSVNKKYSIDFPGADFFYPAFTDDLLANSDSLKYLGECQIGGRTCFHILSVSKDMDIQLWITNDAYNLPQKFVIIYKDKKGNPQYEGTFSEWQVNPNLPAALFDFQPPPGAGKVKLLAKNEK